VEEEDVVILGVVEEDEDVVIRGVVEEDEDVVTCGVVEEDEDNVVVTNGVVVVELEEDMAEEDDVLGATWGATI
jgi:hypothetical protein